MARFVRRCVAFVALQGTILVTVVGLSGMYDMDTAPFAALVDKHERLERLSGPRIIIVGDSSGAFSWRSDVLARATGRPVVNLALHVGLGLPFILREARSVVRPGDTVILNIGYQHYDAYLARGLILTLAVAHRPACLRFLGLRELGLVLDDLHVLAGSAARNLATRLVGGPPAYSAPYRRFDFAASGDVRADRGTPVAELSLDMSPLRNPPGLLAETQGLVRDFVSDARAGGVRVAVAFPALVGRLHDENRDAISRIHAALARIDGLALLNAPADERADATEFFDTYYHPRSALALRRTRRLVGPIRDLLAGEGRELPGLSVGAGPRAADGRGA